MNSHKPDELDVDLVIISKELEKRPNRIPNYAAELHSMDLLATAMAESPKSVFQILVESAKTLCNAGSAGISVWDEHEYFHWLATTGNYGPYLGQTLPRHFSPCGTVLDRNAVVLMSDPVRAFPYISELNAPIDEVLLIPFHQGKKPIGTVWLVAHDARKKFDDEDVRVVTNLTKFASAAITMIKRVEDAELAEAELRDVRTRLEATLIAGEVGTWTFDIEQNQVRADRNLARMFGVSEADALGGPLEAYTTAIHPDDRYRVGFDINAALGSGDSFESEYRLIGPDANIRWVVARGQVVRDESGKAIRLPGVVVDITDRVLAERLLRDSENRRHLALKAGELGTWNIDVEHNTMISDERFRRIFTGKSEDLTYEQAFAKIHPDDVQKIRDGVAAATDSDDPQPYQEEYRVVHDDGKLRWVFAQGRANFISENGTRRLSSFDGTIADVTDRKNLEYAASYRGGTFGGRSS